MDTQSRSLHGEELEGRAHRRGLRRDDLGRKHLGGLAGGSELAFLAVAGALGLLLVLGAALGVPLLAGVVVAYVLGFFVAAAAHGFVGSLLAGIFVKYRRRGWGYLDDIHHAVLPLIALVLAAALIRLDLWVVHVSIGAVHTLEYFAAATVGAALMTWLTYLALDPDRLKSSGTTRAICLLAILFGLVAGAVLMVATVGVSAWYRHAHLVQTAIPVSPISHMTGEYVALG